MSYGFVLRPRKERMMLRHGERAVREVRLHLERQKQRRDPTYTSMRKGKLSHA